MLRTSRPRRIEFVEPIGRPEAALLIAMDADEVQPHARKWKMSLYGALNIGVAGLQANSIALSATSSNIANVNTVGYKKATAAFSTFLNATTGVGNNSSAGVSG